MAPDIKDVDPRQRRNVDPADRDKDPAEVDQARKDFNRGKAPPRAKAAPKKKPAANAGKFDGPPPSKKPKVDLAGGSARADFGRISRPTPEQISHAQQKLASGSLRGPDSAKAMDVLEAALSDPKAAIVKKTSLGGGVNGTFIVTLSNGIKAVWKPSAKENMTRLRTELEEDHQARREAASYLVDKQLGHLAGVPPTLYRTLDGEGGALMAYVAGASTANDAGAVDGEYGALAVFDDVVGNTDRHTGNLLVTRYGRRIPIDHGLTFPLVNGPQGFHNFLFSNEVTLSKAQVALLSKMLGNRQKLAAQLAALGLDNRAIKAMFDRVKVMIDTGKTSDAWRE